MTQQQIEKAANAYIGHEPEFDEGVHVHAERLAFVNGARWRINSVWHDANEKPNGMFVILIDFGTEISPEEFGLGLTAEDLNGARRWAYVSDLLPERKEETNGSR